MRYCKMIHSISQREVSSEQHVIYSNNKDVTYDRMSQACLLPESAPRKIDEFTDLMKFCFDIKNHNVV